MCTQGLFPVPPRGFRGPGAKLQNEAPCDCDLSKQKGQKARESGGTESGGTLRTLWSYWEIS